MDFLLSLSVLSLIPLTDLFFNSEENFSKITIFIISIIKDINLPVNLLTFFLFIYSHYFFEVFLFDNYKLPDTKSKILYL